jgi:hypothetical protein
LIFYGKKEEKGKGFAKDSNLLNFEIFCSKFKRFFQNICTHYYFALFKKGKREGWFIINTLE